MAATEEPTFLLDLQTIEDPLAVRANFLRSMVRAEIQFRTLFRDLSEHIKTAVVRAAAISPNYEDRIDLSEAEKLRKEIAQLVTFTFLGRDSRGNLAPYEERAGKVVPLSPYTRILWPLLQEASRSAVQRHRDILERFLGLVAPELLEGALKLFDRRSQRIVVELEQPNRRAQVVSEAEGKKGKSVKGTKYELSFYEAPHTWVTPDGYRLSDRIWNTAEAMRAELDQYLTEAIAGGYSSMRIAQDVERFLNPGQELPISRMPYGRKVIYNAMRLARTEIAAAYNESDWRAANNNPALIGYNILLSNRHPEPDICDHVANAGPHEKSNRLNVPPLHPNCLCTLAWEFTDDVPTLIENLRAEIEAEFPGSIVAGKLRLEGVRLPQVGVSRMGATQDDLLAKAEPKPPEPKPPEVKPAEPAVATALPPAPEEAKPPEPKIEVKPAEPAPATPLPAEVHYLQSLSMRELEAIQEEMRKYYGDLSIASSSIQALEEFIALRRSIEEGELSDEDIDFFPVAIRQGGKTVGFFTWKYSEWKGKLYITVENAFASAPDTFQLVLDELKLLAEDYEEEYSFLAYCNVGFKWFAEAADAAQASGFTFSQMSGLTELVFYRNSTGAIPEQYLNEEAEQKARPVKPTNFKEALKRSRDYSGSSVYYSKDSIFPERREVRVLSLSTSKTNESLVDALRYQVSLWQRSDPLSTELIGSANRAIDLMQQRVSGELKTRVNVGILMNKEQTAVEGLFLYRLSPDEQTVVVEEVAVSSQVRLPFLLNTAIQNIDSLEEFRGKDIRINLPAAKGKKYSSIVQSQLRAGPFIESEVTKSRIVYRVVRPSDVKGFEVVEALYRRDEKTNLLQAWPEAMITSGIYDDVPNQLIGVTISPDEWADYSKGLKLPSTSERIEQFLDRARESGNSLFSWKINYISKIGAVGSFRVEVDPRTRRLSHLVVDDLLLSDITRGFEGCLFSSFIHNSEGLPVHFSEEALDKLFKKSAWKQLGFVRDQATGYYLLTPDQQKALIGILPRENFPKLGLEPALKGKEVRGAPSDKISKSDLQPLDWRQYGMRVAVGRSSTDQFLLLGEEELSKGVLNRLIYSAEDEESAEAIKKALRMRPPNQTWRRTFVVGFDSMGYLSNFHMHWETDEAFILDAEASRIYFASYRYSVGKGEDLTFFLDMFARAAAEGKRVDITNPNVLKIRSFQQLFVSLKEGGKIKVTDLPDGGIQISFLDKDVRDYLRQLGQIDPLVIYSDSRRMTEEDMPFGVNRLKFVYDEIRERVQKEPENWQQLNPIHQYRTAQANSFIAMDTFSESFDHGFLKEHIARSIAARISEDEGFRRMVAERYDDITKGKTGRYRHQYSRIKDDYEEAVAWMVKAWAFTSSDDGELSVALQIAAQREFGLKPQHFFSPDVVDRALSIYGKYIEDGTMGRFLRAQYELTQEHFQQLGITRVWAWRGMTMPTGPYGFRSWSEMPRVAATQVRLNPLSSYTSRKYVTNFFSLPSPGAESDTAGVVLGGLVNVEDILSLPISGFGCANEYEYVVLQSAEEANETYVWVNPPTGFLSEEVLLQELAIALDLELEE